MEHLHRLRRRQQQAAKTGKIRRRSNAIIDTDLGPHPRTTPIHWSEDHQVQRSLKLSIHHSAPRLAAYLDSPF
jgi:hypothetical protein